MYSVQVLQTDYDCTWKDVASFNTSHAALMAAMDVEKEERARTDNQKLAGIEWASVRPVRVVSMNDGKVKALGMRYDYDRAGNLVMVNRELTIDEVFDAGFTTAREIHLLRRHDRLFNQYTKAGYLKPRKKAEMFAIVDRLGL